MKKSLYELGLEYDESIRLTQDVVDSVRKKITQAEKNNDSYEVFVLSRKLEMLYEEIRDMRIISEKLKTYYDKEKISKEIVA